MHSVCIPAYQEKGSIRAGDSVVSITTFKLFPKTLRYGGGEGPVEKDTRAGCAIAPEGHRQYELSRQSSQCSSC